MNLAVLGSLLLRAVTGSEPERGRSRRSCKSHEKVTAKRRRSGDTAVVNPMRSQALFIRRATRSVSRKMGTSRLLLGTYRFYDRTV